MNNSKNNKECKGCKYWRPLSKGQSTLYFACHYIIDEKKMRNCDPKNCNKKVVGQKKHRKWCCDFTALKQEGKRKE